MVLSFTFVQTTPFIVIPHFMRAWLADSSCSTFCPSHHLVVSRHWNLPMSIWARKWVQSPNDVGLLSVLCPAIDSSLALLSDVLSFCFSSHAFNPCSCTKLCANWFIRAVCAEHRVAFAWHFAPPPSAQAQGSLSAWDFVARGSSGET